MTLAERTTKITRVFEWLKDTNNHTALVDLYGSNKTFKLNLDGLLNDGAKASFLQRLERFFDMLQSCGRGDHHEMLLKLAAFRTKDPRDLSEEEKQNLLVLDFVLELEQIYGESDSDSSPS
jgi:hypothetical protein